MMHKPQLWIFLSFFILFTAVYQAKPVYSQDLCQAIVQEATQQLGENCTDLERNNACYGYAGLSATFVMDDTETTLNEPGSLVELPVLQAVQTTGIDLDLDEWGLATF